MQMFSRGGTGRTGFGCRSDYPTTLVSPGGQAAARRGQQVGAMVMIAFFLLLGTGLLETVARAVVQACK
jgi:hypothetical protein